MVEVFPASSEKIFRYVIAPDVPAYEALGWLVTDVLYERGGNLCFLMGWTCGCLPREPQ